MAKISVIIPTFNRAQKLYRCLDSLVAQTYTDFEVLVCDDGSTDNTEQVVRHFTTVLNIKYFFISNFGGPAKPRNVGIQAASGLYVAFLDSDDWWTPDKLLCSFQSLESGYDVVYHDMYLMPEKSRNPSKLRLAKTRTLGFPAFDDLLLNGNGIVNSSLVTYLNLIKSVHGFPEDAELIAAEDYACWLRLSRITEKFYRIPGCHGYYAIGIDNISVENRKISTTLKILQIYSSFLGPRLPSWASYSLSRSYFLLGLRQDFIRYNNRFFQSPACFALFIRSLYMRFICTFTPLSQFSNTIHAFRSKLF